MPYNLTDKQFQIVRDLVNLCNASQHKSFSYTPTFNNRDSVSAHGTSIKADGSERDLRAMESEGLISLRWVRHGAANGTVLPRAFEAVRENFGIPREAPAPVAVAPVAAAPVAVVAAPVTVAPVATPAAVIPAAAPVAAPPTTTRSAAARPVAEHRPAPATPAHAPAPAAAPGGDILYQLSRSVADVSAAFRETLPVDEAEAADADAAAINRQLHSRQPDAEVVARRTRSIVGRVTLAMSGAADLADKGPRYADSLRKLGTFVTLVSQWVATRRAA